jgi:membrane-bound ClpP family serine protease
MEEIKKQLSTDEKKIIHSLEKIVNKFRGLIFAGLFIITVGAIMIVGELLTRKDECHIALGISIIVLGIITIRDTYLSRKLYKLIKKLITDE